MVPWAIIAVPAVTSPSTIGIYLRVFGWPFAHCWNMETDATANEDDAARILELTKSFDFLEQWKLGPVIPQNRIIVDVPYWSNPDHWRYWGPGTMYIEWSWKHLLANCMIGFGVYFVLMVMFEWRIRRRGGLFRFRLIDTFVVAAIMAVPLAIVGNTLAGSARDEGLLAELGELGAAEFTGIYWSSSIPVWLNRLLDNRAETLVRQLDSSRSLFRVTEINLSKMTWNRQIDNATFEKIAHVISSFDQLSRVHVTFDSSWNSNLLEHIDPRGIRELNIEVDGLNTNESHLAGLRHCTGVQSLSVGESSLGFTWRESTNSPTPSDLALILQALKPMKELRELKLIWTPLHEPECAALLDLPSLKTVTCFSITQEARQLLMEGNPGLKIICNPD